MYHTYDAVGNRLTQESVVSGQLAQSGGEGSVTSYQYDAANRLVNVSTGSTTAVDGVDYSWDANGNLLNDGANVYTYDYANRLTEVSNQSSVSSYQYNGLGDRLSQTVNSVTTNYTLDLNTGLTQVLSDGTNTYTYGLGRISQTHTATEYFLGDALGSVRQMTDPTGQVTFAQSYDPYGTVSFTAGTSHSDYGFTSEQYSADTQLLYLRARWYNPADGRLQSRDTWGGDVNRPLSLNRWMYVEGNPVNLTDPSGNSPIISTQILGQVLSQYSGSSSSMNILLSTINCAPATGNQKQYDLTGYLAVAMTRHGRDARVKTVRDTISLGERLGSAAIMFGGYLLFNELEGKGKVWDIKIRMQEELGNNIVLCGTEINCHWFDYSTPGNIHFGYIAGLAKINHYIAAVAGGWAEQTDLQDNAEEEGRLYDWKDCFNNNFPHLDACDNPQDQAAVDFGFELAKKYKNGITDQQLRKELQLNGMGNFQRNPHAYDEYWYQVYPEINRYGADDFNQ